MAVQRTISVKLPHLEEAFLKEANAELKKTTPKVGKSVESFAREHHRYKNRTGKLRKSTKWSGDLSILKRGNKRGITVKANTKYAKFIHGGFTHRSGAVWAPDKFLDKALNAREQPIYVQIFWAIQRAIRRVNR
jgi:hypothetical protein